MLIDKVINTFHIKTDYLRLFAGTIMTALIISLGMVYIADALNFPIGTALPSAFGAIGAALYSAKYINKSV